MCPEGAATYAAWKQGLADGRIAQRRARGAVQLRDRAEISAAAGTHTLDRHKPIDFAAL